MTGRDRGLVLLVPVLWGLNFPATTIMLQHYPPILAVALRFTLLSIPTILFIPRPKVKLKWLIGTGVGLGLFQFALLYLGMVAGMPPGLASITLQASAPFTIVLAAALLRERLSRRQVIGVLIAVGGLVVIAAHRAQHAAFLPVGLTLLAGLSWAAGNICSRLAQAPKPILLTMWMSVIPPIPLYALSLVVEGPSRITHTLATAATMRALPAAGGLLYIVICASILGYGIWNTLLSRYPSSLVAPWSMLVPVIGVLSSWAIFAEVPSIAELLGGVFVVGGVLFASVQLRRRQAAELTETPPAG